MNIFELKNNFIKFKKNMKEKLNTWVIYVLCPAKWITWWPEALHQLAYKLTCLWINVKIAYFPKIDNPMPELYNKYYPNVCYTYADNIIDDKNNFLICPEAYIKEIDKFNFIKKSIWLLSVDWIEKRIPISFYNLWFFIIKLLWKIIWINNKIYDFSYRLFFFINNKIWCKYIPKDNNILYFYQSKYAENFILNKNKKYICYPLSDYLNYEFIKNTWYDISKKENIVAYNPKKWFKYTNKLIKLYGDKLKFIPIINMTPNEVQLLLKRAKVYIDFWNHPWKDRIPREAALQWCCIITNIKWSAKFYSDIPILLEYSFEKFNAKNIYCKINEIFNNYENKVEDFWIYREEILKQELIFEEEVKNIFL